MNISILAVGTELLMGKTVNTNATYLSKHINALGHNVLYHLTVGDNPDRLSQTLNYLLEISDMVITTGGLGPTQDDLTKETVADTLSLNLIKDELAFTMMASRFKSFNVEMTQNNIKQAYLPEGSTPMYNQKGTAPGFISEKKGKIVAVLPGPPHEMEAMFESSLLPYLEERADGIILSEYINLFGIGESSAESLIEDLVSEQSNPSIAIYANIGQVSIRVTSKSDTIDNCIERIQETVGKILERLGDYVIGFGKNTLLDETIELLIKKNLTVSTAESCTGGMIASEFIGKSGASAFFDRGLVTYSNESKMDILNVSSNTLEQYGAVSEETCLSMLQGLDIISESDILLAVTGIAGPSGGTTEKPVGLVYIGVKYDNYVKVTKFNFTGDRHTIRKRSYLNGINMIRQVINTCK